ncbi:helix-turn-helix domain-containing protein [Paeniglutamicibacter gangotriensis]|uniref:helix-turn-helix domain-containing protein n=1 Tax=Paeniglutamicibacter gangotriensis TaxID=254787 RepID=UPI0021D24F2A|nr:helix-turn-helix domain-containing protein [Paeniglutamicibacter gangotriensis]
MKTKASIATVARVASTVRETRESLHLTQDQLAESAQVSRTFIGNLENGHTRAELGKVLDVITALGLRPSVILETPVIQTEARTVGIRARSRGFKPRRTKTNALISPVGQTERPKIPATALRLSPSLATVNSPSIDQTLALIEKGQQLAGHHPSSEAIDRARRVLDGTTDVIAARAELAAKYQRARA